MGTNSKTEELISCSTFKRVLILVYGHFNQVLESHLCYYETIINECKRKNNI